MPRKSTVEELTEQPAAVGSPVRRSTRLISGNGNGTPGRSAQTTESNPPARVLRTRRASAHDIEEVESKPAPRTRRTSTLAEEEQSSSTPVRRGRKPSVTKESEDQEETVKPKIVRGRRASNTSVEDPDEKTLKPAGVRTRRGSANVEPESKTPAKLTSRRGSSEIAATEEVSTPAKRTTRARKNSDSVEIIEDTKPATRGRRKSITLEEEGKVEEKKPVARRSRRASSDSLASDTGPGTPTRRTTRRSSINQEEVSPIVEEVSIKSVPFKKRGIIEQIEADLDLSIINESDDAIISEVDQSKSINISPASRKRLSTINEIGSPLRKSPRLSPRVNSPTIINLDASAEETQVTTTQIFEEKLNTSPGSNKENITVNEILERSVQTPIAFSARVSNVFKPNQREYSFMEPMEVDQTINQSLALEKSLVASNSPKIVADSTSNNKPILKKLSVVLCNVDKLATELDVVDSTSNQKNINATNSDPEETDESLIVFGEDPADSALSGISLRVITENENSLTDNFLQPKEEVEDTCSIAASEINLLDTQEQVYVKEEIEEFLTSEVAPEDTNIDICHLSTPVVSQRKSKIPQTRQSLQSKNKNDDIQIEQKTLVVEEYCIKDKVLDTVEDLNTKKLENQNVIQDDVSTSNKNKAEENVKKSQQLLFDESEDEDGDNNINEASKEGNKSVEEIEMAKESAKKLKIRKLEVEKELFDDSDDEVSISNINKTEVNKAHEDEKQASENRNESVKEIEMAKKLNTSKLEIEKELFDDSEDEVNEVSISNMNKTGEIKNTNEDEEQDLENRNKSVKEIEMAKKPNTSKLEIEKELFDDSEDEVNEVSISNMNKTGEIKRTNENEEQALENRNKSVKEIEMAEKLNTSKLEIEKELFDDSEDEVNEVSISNMNKTGEIKKTNENEEQALENRNKPVKETEMAEKLNTSKLEIEKELFDDSEDEDGDVNTSNINNAEKTNKNEEQASDESAKDIETARKISKILFEDQEQVSENDCEIVEDMTEPAQKEEVMTNEIVKKTTPTKPSPKARRSLDEFASTKLAEYFESKTDYVVNSTDEEESNDDEEEENSFVIGMAEEGEEDTPSEDSNQIIDHGESIGSSDSVDDEQSDDELDSFICDDEDPGELLSGEEFDLDIEEEMTNKKSRIMNNEQFGDEEVIKMPQKTEKPKRILTRIITVSSSSEEEIADEPIKEDIQDSEDNEHESSNRICEIQESKSNDNVNKETSVNVDFDINESIISTGENNNSKVDELRHSLNVLNQSRHRKSSLTIQENIFVDGAKDPRLTQRINSLVESFCSNVKKGEVSLNLSLEFENTGEEEDTAKNINILNNVTIQQGTTDTEIIDHEDAGPSEVENIAEENIINQPEITEPEIWENIEEIIPSDHSEIIDELNKTTEQVDLREVINRKLKRRLSKSLSEVYEENKKAKKRKKNNGKAKPKPDLTEYLGATSFGLMNQLITDVKNRPRRKIKPSTSAVANEAWTSTVVLNLKPSTSVLKEEKKPVPKPKLHPKDFKNQMLTDPIRVRRVETKTLLKKKGAFY
ncbi:unnamed protein product [Ceutorhynchus assimilis]|uniref:Uncharacterized protein n=1 Tax=Ceutorhynchus assimilis TaxID=467358 RepID=A0A9N9MKD7_9CUCU|nr:unnamed protein product [Ceutorhynchus assimilis]